jgi:RNA polymerase sigma-70 factor (ECF subfamily)
LVRRDETSLRRLIDIYGSYVYGRTLQILRQPHLAEEAAQDALLVLWWDPTRFDVKKGSLRSFLMGVARFKAIDIVRHEETARSRDELAAEAEGSLMMPATDDAIEESLVIRDAISQLPLPKREVIYLAYYRGLTYREVSNVLSIPEGTVKTRIRSSLVSLKALMNRAEPA